MIKRLSHATVFVLDQDEALAFYTEKLGFEVRTDLRLEGFRWLTVSPPGQTLELILMALAPGMGVHDAGTVEQIRALVAGGALGPGVFETDDCHATYAALSARGVEFIAPPTERPYGIEAMLKDCSGNWFSLTQPR